METDKLSEIVKEQNNVTIYKALWSRQILEVYSFWKMALTESIILEMATLV